LWQADKPLTGLCGTPDYVAPEVLTWYDDDENGTPYGKGSDLWSLGVLLYVILSGCSPFCADEEEALLKQVAQAKYEFFENEWKGISEEAKKLISQLLVVDPEKRLTMAQLMEHPWLCDAVAKTRQEIEAKRAKLNGGGASAAAAPPGKPAAPAVRRDDDKPKGARPLPACRPLRVRLACG
jgi:calcium/calmodulin-dependent protein kinase I